MKKTICFFLAVIFLTAMLASCQLFEQGETSSTTPSNAIVTEPSTSTASTQTTPQSSEATTAAPSTGQTSESTATEPTTVVTEPSATTEDTSSTVPTATTEPTGTTQGSVTPMPPQGAGGISLTSVADLFDIVKNGENAKAIKYLSASQEKYRVYFKKTFGLISELEFPVFPTFDGNIDILRDDSSIHIFPHANDRFELIFNFDYDGRTGNVFIFTLDCDVSNQKNAAANVLGETRTVYYSEHFGDNSFYTKMYFKYNDVWIVMDVHGVSYEKAIKYLEKLGFADVKDAVYTADKGLKKQLSEICVLPTDIGSAYEDDDAVWFAGDASDIQNNRTRAFGLKNGETFFGFDVDIKYRFDTKKIALDVFAFDTDAETGNSIDVDIAELGNYYKSLGIDVCFWNDKLTILPDVEDIEMLESMKIKDHESYRIGYFLAALPLNNPDKSKLNTNDGYKVVLKKCNFGEIASAKSILLEKGDDFDEKDVEPFAREIEKAYWKKVLAYYGIKDEQIVGYSDCSSPMDIMTVTLELDESQLETMSNIDGYITQIATASNAFE